MAENVILVNEQDLENLFLKWQKSKVEVKPDPPLKSKGLFNFKKYDL